jgi:hypothetical protein
VYGNPAQPQGWISRNGYRLVFNETGEAFCQEEGMQRTGSKTAGCRRVADFR